MIMLIDPWLHVSEPTIKNTCIINCVYNSWDKLSVFKLVLFLNIVIGYAQVALPESILYSMRR